ENVSKESLSHADAAITLRDLEGRSATPLAGSNAAAVLIFLSPDCPLSNPYTREIRRLHERFSPTIKFWVVYPGTNFSLEALRKHRTEYRYGCEAVRDPELRLAKASQVRVTPEAAVWSPTHELIYHGRIDDLFVDFGVKRRAP